MKIKTIVEIKKEELYQMIKDYFFKKTGVEFVDNAEIKIYLYEKPTRMKIEIDEVVP